ncbi:MAG: hypothetical protein HRU17_18915 [Polyangiaceae bacterium]|nr:hypothetical protein [Polyangiaceae bacterium]
MTDPIRLLAGDDDVAKSLLRAARAEEPADGALGRSLAAVGAVGAIGVHSAAAAALTVSGEAVGVGGSATTAPALGAGIASAGAVGSATVGSGVAGAAITATGAVASGTATGAASASVVAAQGVAAALSTLAGKIVVGGLVVATAASIAGGGGDSDGAQPESAATQQRSAASLPALATPTQDPLGKALVSSSGETRTDLAPSPSDPVVVSPDPSPMLRPSVIAKPPGLADNSLDTFGPRSASARNTPLTPADGEPSGSAASPAVTPGQAPPTAVYEPLPSTTVVADVRGVATEAAAGAVAETKPAWGAEPVPVRNALLDEVHYVDQARQVLRGGDATTASRWLAGYGTRFPGGALAPEVQYLKMELALSQRNNGRARAIAQTIVARYPHSPQAQRARRLIR